MNESINKDIAIIGCGNMGGALISGLVNRHVIAPEKIFVFDSEPARALSFVENYGVRTVDSVADAVKNSQLIVVAVKPGVVREVLWLIAETPMIEQPLVVSVAAGVTTKEMRKVLGESWPVVRVMPNLPCTYGCGMSAYYLTNEAVASYGDPLFNSTLGGDHPDVRNLLSSLGRVVRVTKEKELDAVTGLSGSGPAFVFAMIEALADGGVKMGLPRAIAQTLAAQTLLGAAQMVLESNSHPGQLKDMVASPGGTTICGLHVLEKGGLRGLLMSAVEASAMRAEELSKE